MTPPVAGGLRRALSFWQCLTSEHFELAKSIFGRLKWLSWTLKIAPVGACKNSTRINCPGYVAWNGNAGLVADPLSQLA
jgi:hypothetical protein